MHALQLGRGSLPLKDSTELNPGLGRDFQPSVLRFDLITREEFQDGDDDRARQHRESKGGPYPKLERMFVARKIRVRVDIGNPKGAATFKDSPRQPDPTTKHRGLRDLAKGGEPFRLIHMPYLGRVQQGGIVPDKVGMAQRPSRIRTDLV